MHYYRQTEQERAREFLSLTNWHIKYQKTVALLLINEGQVRADKKGRRELHYCSAIYDLFLIQQIQKYLHVKVGSSYSDNVVLCVNHSVELPPVSDPGGRQEEKGKSRVTVK